MASNADRVVAKLTSWPAVSVVRADCGHGVGVRVDQRQVLHLHNGDEAELRLTRPVIERLGDTLLDSGRVAVQPGGDWVRIPLTTESDVALVVSLTSVAIKAAAAEPVSPCGAVPSERNVPWRRPQAPTA